MCWIAEILITLQEAGNVKYIGWSMEFNCHAISVDDLRKQAKDMEDELELWNKEVTKTRNEFCELNYYTTRQLLVLRSELAKMKKSGPAIPQSQQAQVIVLLQSISSKVTTKSVEDIVQCITCQLLEGGVDAEPPLDSSVNQFGDTLLRVEPMDEPLTFVSHVHSTHHTSLCREQLNKKQEEYFLSMKDEFRFCDETALKAIEEVGNGDWNEYLNWVHAKGGQYEEQFRKEDEEEEEEEEGEEEEQHEDEAEEGEKSEGGEEFSHKSGDYSDQHQKNTTQG